MAQEYRSMRIICPHCQARIPVHNVKFCVQGSAIDYVFEFKCICLKTYSLKLLKGKENKLYLSGDNLLFGLGGDP